MINFFDFLNNGLKNFELKFESFFEPNSELLMIHLGKR